MWIYIQTSSSLSKAHIRTHNLQESITFLSFLLQLIIITMKNLSIILSLLLLSIYPNPAFSKQYAAIFNFGDSLADAGNLCVDGIPDFLSTAKLPYGMNYFGYPTGRCSDGRVAVDFIAQELGLPLLPPSNAHNATFHRGANFAITGATALDKSFFDERGVGGNIWVKGSLHTQLKWFEDMKPSICNSTEECKDLFGKSLFIVGEFGGNDYNAFFFKDIQETHTVIIPSVIGSIVEAIEKLISMGAVDLVVPGVLPIGCSPVYLTIFKSEAKDYGAQTGCLKRFNTLSWVHNSKLQRAILELRNKYPGVTISYADYYTPIIQFILHPEDFGFDKQPPRACCGAPGHGPYNFNMSSACGAPGAVACDDPKTHWNWDGMHLTEASYAHISKGWLYGPYADPPILATRSNVTESVQ
ncbi:hypothetical protein LUZ60_009713 [Juncus effusus]|nr:hypothetical protein LUZ60_009713 [Juncus effusus]